VSLDALSPRVPARRERPSYLPIAEHGVIGDLRTAALIGTDGTIDWYCPDPFDGPSVFGALLDRGRGGFYRIAPTDPLAVTKQLYLPDTNVLITRFLAPEGVSELEDFMPVDGGPQRLIRRLTGVRGSLGLRLEVAPRFDYGRIGPDIEATPDGAVFRAAGHALALAAPVPLQPTSGGARADFELRAGERRTFVLEASDRTTPVAETVSEQLRNDTAMFWRNWLARSSYQGRWREMVHRSALTLKLLSYEPSGAIVAAATTSLPEQLGGRRNWDYR
jgi:GH15 family glucan-1,4-alpha-glucosidase